MKNNTLPVAILVGLATFAGVIAIGNSRRNKAQMSEVAYIYRMIDQDIDFSEYRKHNIHKLDLTDRVLLPSAPVRASAEEEAAPTLDETSALIGCILRTAIITDIREEILHVVPATNLLTYHSVEAVFEDALATCDVILSQVMIEEEVVEEPAPRAAAPDCLNPEYCFQFIKTRRSHCLAELRNGICYRPQQSDLIRDDYWN